MLYPQGGRVLSSLGAIGLGRAAQPFQDAWAGMRSIAAASDYGQAIGRVGRAFAAVPRIGVAVVVVSLVGCVPAVVDMPFGLADQKFLETFYDPANVATLRFDLTDDALTTLSGGDTGGWGGAREYAPAHFTYTNPDGEEDSLEGDVGIRLKGSGSFRPLTGKAAFKVKFNEFEKGQRFHGLRHITLNNMMLDSTMMSEVLAYRQYRDVGVSASRCAYAKVYVNDDYYGLHANVESVEEEMLQVWFGDGSGNLYESENGGDLSPDGGSDTGWSGTVSGFTQQQGDENSDIAAVADAVKNAPDETWYSTVSAQVDMTNFLRYLALNQATTNPDGYGTGHNFFVYHDPNTGKWFFLPWSLDLSFYDYYGGGVNLANLPGAIGERCSRDPACTKDFLDASLVVADEMQKVLPSDYDRARGIVEENFALETRNEVDQGTWTGSVDTLSGVIARRPDEIRGAVNSLR
jgi:hypothetical protein